MSHVTPAPLATSETESGPPTAASRTEARTSPGYREQVAFDGSDRTSRIDPPPVAGHNPDGRTRPHPHRADTAPAALPAP